MAPKPLCTPAEWEVLQYLTEHPASTVREVTDGLSETQERARTTVLTLLERLRERGYVTRKKVGGVYRYSPSEPGSDTLQGLVREFVQKALGGSISPFVAYLSGGAKLSARERAELLRLARELEDADPGEAADD